MTALAELAEDTLAHVLPSPMFRPVERGGYVLVEAPTVTYVTRIRRVDVDAVRAEAATPRVEWWVGWSAPAGTAEELLAAGLVPDEVPTLTGMTCSTAPPTVDGVEVRPATLAEVIDVEREVWGSEPTPPPLDAAPVRHFAALVDGAVAGVGRSVDMDEGVALMGGAVLPAFRSRGVYRALIRARWEHAVARDTPLLVVQAGALSQPVLARLGFEAHGVLHLFVDPGVASGHGDD